MLPLEQACFSMPWSENQFRDAFAQKNFAAFGLRAPSAQDVILAYISFYHAAGELEILNIAVSPEHRRRGRGGRLLCMALQVAQKMDMQRAVLEVRVNNTPAIRLYERTGFVRVGRRPRYYADTGEDALVYALTL